MQGGEDRAKKVLVLGASGGIGGETARQLRDAGWQVVALKRGLVAAHELRDGIHWLRGDALNAADVAAAARECGVLVHAVNPPGYRDWDRVVLPMLEHSIAAARAEGATLVLPGTVYNFGPDAFPLLREDSPQRPLTRKGAIRVEMERRLRMACETGLRVLIVRAGDFFGPKAGNNWFSQGLVKPGRPVATISNPGAPGVGHQWAYLPDVARTLVELLARRDGLPAFASFHMAGHWDASGREMAEAIQRVVARHGGTPPRIVALPWWLLNLASPFVATLREMREMRYLWQRPVRMDNSRLVAALGQEPHTPLEEAVEAALRGQGCLPPRTAGRNMASSTFAGTSP
ncbi:MAG TPA: sugar nucleotide-binding protein [Roseateles sp.]|uniref:sugar nucleotide-binding protein n=1 Tax=Roseateles sp. TaxID=1971397 RepID=UPI002EDAC3BB